MKTAFSAALAFALVGAASAQDEGKKGKGQKFDGGQLFARLDKNGDGKLDKPEMEAAPERLRGVLERADADKNGEVSKDEMTRAMATAGMKGKGAKPKGDEPKPGDGKGKKPPMPGGELGGRIKALDKNGDGKISKDEAQGPLAQFFDRLDRNADGFITPDEANEAGKKFGKGKDKGKPPKGNDKPKGEEKPKGDEPKPGDGKGKKFGKGSPKGDLGPLATMDADGDGKISKNEAKGPLATNFDRFDVNRDGYIAGDEMQAIRRMMAAGAGGGKSAVDLFNQQDGDADGRLARDEAKGELAANFDKWDADKDGKLTRQEVEAGMKGSAQEKAK